MITFKIAAIILFLAACMHPVQKSTTTYFDKQGHRGCRALMPENTIPAMLRAVDLGVNTLEMDVVITKDRQVILSHEPFFNHEVTTGPGGKFVSESEERSLNIYQMDYAQTLSYDVGMKPHPRFPHQQKMKVNKPLLLSVIDSVEHYCKEKRIPPVHYNIETKTLAATDNLYHPPPQAFVDLLMQVILSKKVESRVIIQSFDFRTLQYVHKKYPFMKTAMLIDENDHKSFNEQIGLLGFIPSIYSPHYSLVNKELIDACHEKGIKVLPWTVDDSKHMQTLKQLGVDGLISDDPTLYREL